jgi:putative transposase
LDNTPSWQAGSFPGLRRLAEGDPKKAHRAVSTRSALFIAGLAATWTQQQRIMMTRLGTRKHYYLIKPSLDREGIKYGCDKLLELLRYEVMLVKKKRNYIRTTNSYHRFYKYPNLIKDLEINLAEQVWASDITYIRTSEGYMYLSLITDVYSKQVVGHQLPDNHKTINCIIALKEAIKNRKYPDRALIHHSDRGFQYCSSDYIETLESNQIGISMTTKHDPYENAVA